MNTLRCLALASASFFLSTVFTFAEVASKADDARGVTTVDPTWYQNNKAILSNNNVISSGIRWLGWGIIKVLCLFADTVQSLYDKTFGLIDITNYPAINNIVAQLRPVLAALMVLCVTVFAVMSFFSKEKRPILRNVVLAMLVLSSSTYIFITANALVGAFKDGMLQEQSTTEAYKVVNDNMTDLVYLDDKSHNIRNVNYKAGRGIVTGAGINSQDTFDAIDYNEVLDYNDGKDIYGWSDDFNELIQYKLVHKATGNDTTTKVSDGFKKIGNNFYYRYQVDFWSCILQLFAIVLMFTALAYKNVRIAYELVIARILAYMHAADLNSGERLKSILLFIRDVYITLCISVLSIRLYQIISGALKGFGITGLSRAIVLVFVAYAVIDGPNIVERILGMDAGLSSSFARTMAMFGAAKGVALAGVAAGRSGVRTAEAVATGKSYADRHPNGASSGEIFGKKLHNKFSKDNSIMEGKEDEGLNAGVPAATDIMGEANFMNDSTVVSKDNVGSGVIDTSFMNGNAVTPEASQKNEFSRLHEELKPDANASKGEKKFFHEQMDSITSGNGVIEPPKGARAPYYNEVYEKAKVLHKAYKSVGEEKKGGKK